MQSKKQQPEKESVEDADAFSTVLIPNAECAGIVNPTDLKLEGLCHWCRKGRGDLYCDSWPICFDCIEIIIERENALAILDAKGLGGMMRNEKSFDAWTPWGWERD